MLYTVGSHTKAWAVGTRYGLGQLSDYASRSGISKEIVYKASGNNTYTGTLEIDTSGAVYLTPHSVIDSDVVRIFEAYV